MAETWWHKPFSKDEMEEIRNATRDEPTLAANFWALLRRVGRNLPFAEDALAVFYCTFDPATSPRVRFILLGAIAYLVMPFDAIPDVIPIFGFTDDAAVMAAAIAAVRGAITEAHYEKARAALKEAFGRA